MPRKVVTRRSQKLSLSPSSVESKLSKSSTSEKEDMSSASMVSASVIDGLRSPPTRTALHHRSCDSLLMTPPPPIQEESPTSIVAWHSPLEQHISLLLDLSPSDLPQLTLVSDNARIRTSRTNGKSARPSFLKSASESSVMRRFEKREHRWNPEVLSPQANSRKSEGQSSASSSSMESNRRLDDKQSASRQSGGGKTLPLAAMDDIPPPPAMSVDSDLRKRIGTLPQPQEPLVVTALSADSSPMKPQRQRQRRGQRPSLQGMRQTSDSLLVRPERRGSVEIDVKALEQFARDLED